MNKQIYLGGTPLIDLSGYATESYVDTAVANVDVTEQLENYALKNDISTFITDASARQIFVLDGSVYTKEQSNEQLEVISNAINVLDASVKAIQIPSLDGYALDASLAVTNSSLATLQSVVAQITGEGADVTAAIDTFNELKQFVADYTSANDLSTLIATVKSEAIADASADAASKYQPIGNYLTEHQSLEGLATTQYVDTTFATKNDVSAFITADDISTFVDAADVASAIDSSITALNLAQYAKDASLADYLTTTAAASVYATKNEVSTNVSGSGITAIVKCTSDEYAAIQTKSATTLYIVSD